MSDSESESEGSERTRGGRKVGLVDRKLHVLPSHKFSAGAAAWGDLYASPSPVALGSRTTFRRDKRSLLITLRVLDARLIAEITGINARVR